MTQPPIVLHDFQSQRPEHHAEQGAILEWIAAAHARAEITLRQPGSADERAEITRKLRKLVLRFGCSTDRIQTRNSALDDFTHTDWERMRIFQLDRFPAGRPCSDRSRFYREVTFDAFQGFYAGESEPPGALIHVTCTTSVARPQSLSATSRWAPLGET